MHVVLTYDIVADSRRARFHKRLKALLRPVQYSVFQGEIPDSRWSRLVGLVTREIDHRTDSVRVYPLCRACAGLVQSYGVAPELHDPRAPIIVSS